MSGTLPPPPPQVGFILEYRLEDLRNKHGAPVNIFTTKEVMIGKVPEGNIYVHDPHVSGKYAILNFVSEKERLTLQLMRTNVESQLKINGEPMSGLTAYVGAGDHISLGYGATLKIVSMRRSTDQGYSAELRLSHVVAREEITTERSRLLAELSSLTGRQQAIVMRLADLQGEDTMLENQINGALRNPRYTLSAKSQQQPDSLNYTEVTGCFPFLEKLLK